MTQQNNTDDYEIFWVPGWAHVAGLRMGDLKIVIDKLDDNNVNVVATYGGELIDSFAWNSSNKERLRKILDAYDADPTGYFEMMATERRTDYVDEQPVGIRQAAVKFEQGDYIVAILPREYVVMVAVIQHTGWWNKSTRHMRKQLQRMTQDEIRAVVAQSLIDNGFDVSLIPDALSDAVEYISNLD